MGLYKQQIQKIARDTLLWDRLEGKRVLLSGATGMVGKCLTDLFAERNRQSDEGKKIRLIALSRDKERAENDWENALGKRGLAMPPVM